MSDLERFEFVVPGYTPDTMPLDRLIAYLNELIVILGQPSDLHLVDIKQSSTKPVLAMRHDVAVRARHRASEVRQGGGSQRRKQAYANIRRMVSEDGGKTAVLKAREGKLLEFPSVDIGTDQIVHAVRQQTSVEGELIRIGGRREEAQLLIQELSGNVIAGCTAPRALATELGRFLYKPIRVNGVASWHRSGEGVWEITRLQVQSFDPLEEDEIEDVLAKLRKVNVVWPADSMEQLLAMRGDAA
jgi:hypothetical protein